MGLAPFPQPCPPPPPGWFHNLGGELNSPLPGDYRALRGSPGGSAAGNREPHPCPPAASRFLARLPSPARLELGPTGRINNPETFNGSSRLGGGKSEGSGAGGAGEAPEQSPCSSLTILLTSMTEAGGHPPPFEIRFPQMLLPANPAPMVPCCREGCRQGPRGPGKAEAVAAAAGPRLDRRKEGKGRGRGSGEGEGAEREAAARTRGGGGTAQRAPRAVSPRERGNPETSAGCPGGGGGGGGRRRERRDAGDGQ